MVVMRFRDIAGWKVQRSLLLLLPLVLGCAGVSKAQETQPLRGYTTAVNEIKVHYRIGGKGPHLLMLHGFTLTGSQWVPLGTAFMEKYTLIIVDLPGHGGSSSLPGPFSFEKTARLMHALLDQLGIQKVRGIGHSAGGMILLHMAVQRPQRLDAMVLIAGAEKLGPEAKKECRIYSAELLDPVFQRNYIALHPGGQEQVERIIRQLHGLSDNHEVISAQALAKCPVRTLLVWGDRDPFWPLNYPISLYHTLPKAELWVIPGQEHNPLWPSSGGSVEAEKVFPAIVGRFFNGK